MTFYDDIYPFYPLQRTSFIFNTQLLTIILVFLVLAVTFLLILPGIRGKSRFLWMFRIIISLFIGVVIVALNFTSDWAVAQGSTNTSYKSFSSEEVDAEVGLHIGLYGINITLRGNPVNQLNETINYNEMFKWHDTDEEYEKALERGLPNPILYIAEKFTLSSPCGLIYQYRYSGQYASSTLWTAFCCWLLANVLFSMPVILYAGCMMVVTAAFIFFSMASFSTIMNLPSCMFTLGTMGAFQTEYSGSFWLALATGVLCLLIGVMVVILDCVIPERMREAFSVGVDTEEDDIYMGEGYLNSNFLTKPKNTGRLEKSIVIAFPPQNVDFT
uniref:Dual oxidase 2 n=1 Tax=Esox lucius TaxID=8010 RepID=A0A3P8XJT8_ESOLU